MKKESDDRRFTLSILTTLMVVGCLFFATLSVSCSLPFLDKNARSSGGGSGSLTVLVSQGGESGERSTSMARTLVPSLTKNAKSYAITCSQGASVVASKTLDTLTTYTFTKLAPGNYTITVNAYKDATNQTPANLIATGSSEVTLSPTGSPSVTVQLAYIQSTGTGSFSYTLEWPAASATSLRWKFGSEDWFSAHTLTPSGGNYTYTITKEAISSGSYPLIIEFLKGTEVAGYGFEMINVYNNLESSQVVTSTGDLADKRTFTAAEIQSAGSGLAVFISAGGENDHINLNDSSPTGTFIAGTAESITVTPLAGTPGLTIEYQWNDGALTSATAGTAIPNLALVGSHNTLKFKVTPTNSSTSKEYTINISSTIVVMDANALLAALIATGAMSNYIVLGCDITLDDDWQPIGTEESPYTGTFDGNGKTITGLTVIDQGNSGMFHTIGEGGVVKNLHLEAVSITGNSAEKKGALAVYNNGTIYRCSTSGLVAGENNIGGLVYSNSASGIISECWSNATVNGLGGVGGLVGANSGTIVNCYARGAVTARDGGGLVGTNYHTTGKITNSYAAGPVSEKANHLYLQPFVGGNLNNGNPVINVGITNCYFDESKIDTAYAGGGALTPENCNGNNRNGIEMRTQSTFTDWDFSTTWAITRGINGGYPYLQNVTATSDTKVTASDIETKINENLSGDFILTAGGDLGTSFVPFAGDPIPFRGSLDGQDFSLSGVKYTGSTYDFFGLFAAIGKAGFVRNVTLSDVNLSCKTTGGALAGRNAGTLYQCTSRGSVVGESNVGGLVGINAGLIQNCSARGNVRATSYVGGLVGMNKGIIQESFAFAGVYGSSGPVGGLVGSQWSPDAPKISNCYSRGVVASPGILGGFIGSLSAGTIENCYAASGVSPVGTATDAGAFAGNSSAGTTIISSYYDDTRCALSACGHGVGTGITASAAINLSGAPWNTSSNKNGGYPYLTALTPNDDVIILGGTMTATTFTDLFPLYDNGAATADYYLTGDIIITSDNPRTYFNSRFYHPDYQFLGTFDGGGHSITGLVVQTNTGNGVIFPYLGKFLISRKPCSRGCSLSCGKLWW